MNKLINGDCLIELPKLPDNSFDLTFADPPFGINYKYDGYKDNLKKADYLCFSADWIKQVYRTLKPTGSFWLAIGDKYVSELDIICKDLGFIRRNWIVWHFTFGQNCTTKFVPSHTHLLYYVKGKKFTFNPVEIRIPSQRQLNKDKRANPKGRVPGDVWEFSRLCGNFKERVGHPCQMPLNLLKLIIKACSNKDEVVADFMAGSGTTLVAAKELNRKYFGIELSKNYCDIIKERLK